ncbi:hypothetical protein SLEP1_g5245 [Rubroshorea leprosula]|uniref:Lipoprotein n=1 Tax=Rubroshorea leprosula TaxID=152421 RepID=A0AAV5I1W7_9ROSI|nr:hypothetical protein SLEP1_g5245 [Rubroshorea leprosula]
MKLKNFLLYCLMVFDCQMKLEQKFTPAASSQSHEEISLTKHIQSLGKAGIFRFNLRNYIYCMLFQTI